MEDNQGADWIELMERKDEFLHILRILNHYYEMQSQTKNHLYEFRRQLVDSPPQKIQIFLSKIGKYEYFVKASLASGSGDFETWVHIDGIAEERDNLKVIGKIDHPVFSITCLTDLYESATQTMNMKFDSEKKVAKRQKKSKI